MQRPTVFTLISLMLTACATAQIQNPTSPDAVTTVHYGIAEDPPTLDPHLTTSEEVGIVLRQIYDTLIYRNPQTNEFVPGLATDWSVSEDQLTYTFRLRDDVTFHDNTHLDAWAVATNLDRIVELKGEVLKRFGPYRGYNVVDSRTIQIRLTEPYSPLLDQLSQFYFGIASPLALSEYSTLRYQFYQAGTGPYQLIDFIPGTHIILERNPDYQWQPSFYTPASEMTSPAQRIKYTFFIEDTARTEAIASGAIDIASDIPPFAARALSVNAGVQIIPTAIPGQTAQFLINTQLFPTDNLLVRRALLYGTNRNEIADVVFGGFSPVAWGPISSYTLYYSREMNGLYDYDLQQARELLTSAGYSDSDDDGIFDIDGVPLEVKILVPPNEMFTEIADILEAQWQIIGVQAILESEPTINMLREAVATGEYNLVGRQVAGIDPHFLTDYFTTDSTFNWTGYSDPALDTTLDDAIRDNDPTVRAGAYVRAQRAIMNEALVLPIREVVNLNAVNPRVEGLMFDSYGWYPIMHNIQLN